MNKQTYQLIELIGIAGEMPANTIKRISGASEYKRKCMGEAKKANLIKCHRKDRLKGFRLTQSGKQYLMGANRERFQFFIEESSESRKLPSTLQRRLRLHRTAEAYVLMQNAGVEIFRDRKPDLFLEQGHDTLSGPAYYSSREMKELGLEFVKVKNSRAVGVLVQPGEAYLVYNAGSSLLKWYENAEARFRYDLPDYLKRRCGDDFRVKGIMLTDSMSRFHQFFDNTDAKAAFPLDGGGFWAMHWLPDSMEGEAVLKLLTCKEKRDELNLAISQNFNPLPSTQLPVEMDAVGSSGEPVLFAYDLDAARIMRFVRALGLKQNAGIVVCFDFQEEIIQRFCGETAMIKPMRLDDIRREFGL